METGRMKTFDVPHRGLRHALGQLSLLAGTTDYTQPAQVQHLYTLSTDVFRMLDGHAYDEDNIVLMELELRLPGATERNCNEHEQIEKEQRKLEKILDEVLTTSLNGGDVLTPAEQFRMALYRFHAAYQQHMAGEEQETQNLLWQYFTDDELLVHRKKIVGGMPPDMLLLWVRFITPALSAPERTGYLGAMQAAAPPEKFAAIIEFLRMFLSEHEWSELAAGLGYKSAVAV